MAINIAIILKLIDMEKIINTSIILNTSEKPSHKTVLVNETLEALNIEPNKTYLDVTFGCGGHSRAILEKDPNCKVIALDWDRDAVENFGATFEKEFEGRFKIIWGNFGNLYKILRKEGIESVDGIIADFGTSQVQINKKEGFSFSLDTYLDMRMSPAHNYFTAFEVVNRFSEEKLASIIWKYGEEKFAKKIAYHIVNHRKKSKIESTIELAEIIKLAIPKSIQKEKRNKIHPATKTFQALRIFVNKELENLKLFLGAAVQFLAPKARLVCISFHSLEDRLVKNFFQDNQSQLRIISKKPITASDKELAANKSARSAKLRVAEKI